VPAGAVVQFPTANQRLAPSLRHWADLIASGRADDCEETTLLPAFLSDNFCGLVGCIEPARALAAEPLTLERTLSDLVN
jgi:hypothetical protein